MKPTLSSDLNANVLPRNRTLTAEEAGKLDSAPLAAWLTTVVLVLIVICAALWLGVWRERKKHSEAVGAQIMTLDYYSTVLAYAERYVCRLRWRESGRVSSPGLELRASARTADDSDGAYIRGT
jgi:hypothetical protein